MNLHFFVAVCTLLAAMSGTGCGKTAPAPMPAPAPVVESKPAADPVPFTAPDGTHYALEIDPVCKMSIKTDPIVATVMHDGKTYGFCSDFCKESFEKDPAKSLAKLAKKP